MTKVRIVFSDGSIRMAHNLDDRLERWRYRREFTVEDIAEESREGYALPPQAHLNQRYTYDECKTLLTAVRVTITAINARLALMPRENDEVRRHLKRVYQLMLQDNERLKELLKGYPENDIHEKFDTLCRYARDLERLVYSLGYEPPSKPFEWWRDLQEMEDITEKLPNS